MTWKLTSALNIGDRDEQQDRVLILSSGNAHLLVVADGMGGRNNGAIAAQTVIDIAKQQLSFGDNKKPGMFLATICLQAHKAILAQKEDSGSTCVILYLLGRDAYCAHVGDSRMYHFRGNNLLYKTSDHSVSRLIANDKFITEHEPGDQSIQNQLYMCLGGKNKVTPELSAIQVNHGDLLLICSDGLWNQINEQEMLTHMKTGILQPEMAEELTALAMKQGHGQSDNISMACAYWQESTTHKRSNPLHWQPRWFAKSAKH